MIKRLICFLFGHRWEIQAVYTDWGFQAPTPTYCLRCQDKAVYLEENGHYNRYIKDRRTK